MAVVHSHNCVESSCFPLSCRGKFAGGKMEKIGVTCRGDYYLSEYKGPRTTRTKHFNLSSGYFPLFRAIHTNHAHVTCVPSSQISRFSSNPQPQAKLVCPALSSRGLIGWNFVSGPSPGIFNSPYTAEVSMLHSPIRNSLMWSYSRPQWHDTRGLQSRTMDVKLESGR